MTAAPLLAAPITAPARLAATLSGQGHAVLAPAGGDSNSTGSVP